MKLYFSQKPYKAYGPSVSFLGTDGNTKAHMDKKCSSLKNVKRVYSVTLKDDDDFDILPCKLCSKNY